MINWLRIWWLACLIIHGVGIITFAQDKQDTVHRDYTEQERSANVFKRLFGLITRPEADQPWFPIKSEEPFLKYDGKIIREIVIRPLGFDKIVLDTVYDVPSFASRAANNLHRTTRQRVIRNYLFVRKGKPLSPYRLADNERTIRNLDFVLDARIFVQMASGNPDSVDLLVVTRDVFSIGGSLNIDPPGRYGIRIQDKNIAGLGHRLQLTQAYDQYRTPRYAYDVFYQVKNIFGSFIDVGAGYTKLNKGISVGNENEQAFYFRLNRELFHPFARFAGGLEYSDNSSRNVYSEPDSTFSQYHYRIQDYWLGYSFGHKSLPKDLKVNRHRYFVAIRSFKQHFVNGATNIDLTEPDRFAYRERRSIYSELTLFRQDFYKTQYVLGFGRTEDIPYGYRTSFTLGWERELAFKRPYTGTDLSYSRVRPTGSIFTFNLKLGSFWNGKHSEDGLFSFNLTKYSKINKAGRMILRTQFQSGYARLFNQNVKRGIDIRNLNGIKGFLTDSLVGVERFTIGQEITMFTPWKILGFRLAPTGRAELALIQRGGDLIQKQNLFAGFSLGLRARNENLIFNTIEARLFYYPKTVEGLDHFRATIITNFRVTYPTNLVSKPSTVFSYYR